MQLIELGGPVVVVLLALSVMGLTVFLVKLAQYVGYSNVRLRKAERFVTAWVTRNVAGTTRLPTASHSNPYMGLLISGMDWLDAGVDPAQVRDELTRQGQAIVARLNSMNGFVELIAYLAPLGGLLGTVLGMVDVFQGLASAGGSAQTGALAGGIWEALLTTVVGLCVAIPFTLMHALLDGRANRIRAQMEDQMSRLFTANLYRRG
jgi:biopolymer transport protein ExbB